MPRAEGSGDIPDPANVVPNSPIAIPDTIPVVLTWSPSTYAIFMQEIAGWAATSESLLRELDIRMSRVCCGGTFECPELQYSEPREAVLPNVSNIVSSSPGPVSETKILRRQIATSINIIPINFEPVSEKKSLCRQTATSVNISPVSNPDPVRETLPVMRGFLGSKGDHELVLEPDLIASKTPCPLNGTISTNGDSPTPLGSDISNATVTSAGSSLLTIIECLGNPLNLSGGECRRKFANEIADASFEGGIRSCIGSERELGNKQKVIPTCKLPKPFEESHVESFDYYPSVSSEVDEVSVKASIGSREVDAKLNPSQAAGDSPFSRDAVIEGYWYF